jgi:hypothetical protein
MLGQIPYAGVETSTSVDKIEAPTTATSAGKATGGESTLSRVQGRELMR